MNILYQVVQRLNVVAFGRLVGFGRLVSLLGLPHHRRRVIGTVLQVSSLMMLSISELFFV